MKIQLDFNNIKVKEQKKDFTVKILMLKGEKGDTGDLDQSKIVDNLTSTDNTKVLSARQGKVLKDLVDKKPYYFDTVSDMKAGDLSAGDMAITKGYYSVTDGGGAEYIIVDDSNLVDDGGSVHKLNNNLYAKLIINDKVNVLQFGAKGDNTTNDYQKFINAITSSANMIIIPNKTYLIENTILLSNLSNKEIICYGLINAKSSNTLNKSCIELRDCNNITLTGLQISSTRNQTGEAPSGHTRVSTYSSNIVGINLLVCENINILNSNFSNMEYDVRILRRTTDAERGILNKNIYIDKLYSRGASQPIYAQNIENLFINNADIISADDMGDGDHFIYIAQYSKNVHCTNSIFKNGNENYGVAILFAESQFNEDVASPVDFYASNLIVDGFALISAKSISKCYLDNVQFNMIRVSDNSNQTLIYCNENSYIKITNSILKTLNYMINTYSGSPEIEILNCKLNGTSNYMIFNTTSAKIKIANSSLDNESQAIVYVSNNTTNSNIKLICCDISNGGSYTLSSRNPSGNNILEVRNCKITNTSNSAQNYLIYNGNNVASTGISIYSTYIYNYNNIASPTTDLNCIATYINNTLVTI